MRPKRVNDVVRTLTGRVGSSLLCPYRDNKHGELALSGAGNILGARRTTLSQSRDELQNRLKARPSFKRIQILKSPCGQIRLNYQ